MRNVGHAVAVIVLAILVAPVARADPDGKPQWIAVVAGGLREAVDPLIDLRRRQGMQVVVMDPGDHLTAEQIAGGRAEPLAEAVRERCRRWTGPSFVLLVGAATADGAAHPGRFVVPALTRNVGRMNGQPSDNGYGCLDETRLPEVAVGRFPARDLDQARAMVQKTLAWERDTWPGAWKRRFTLLIGPPEFGPVRDRLIEWAALSQLGRLNAHWTGRAIYRSDTSPFTVPDDDLRKQAIDYIDDGQALTFYLGHSLAPGFWNDRTRDDRGRKTWTPRFSRDDWAALNIPRGRGLFVTTGCFGCQLAGPNGQGYGLAAMRNPNGPVAVIGSHGSCWESMVYLLARGVLEALPDADDSPRLADLWLHAKGRLATARISPIVYHLLNGAGGDPDDRPLAVQRDEHLDMFLLLGDPAIRLPSMTHALDLAVSGRVAPNEFLTLRGAVPPSLRGATARITVERPMMSRAPNLEDLPSDPARRRAVMLANHRRSNQFVLNETTARLEGDKFELRVRLPAALPADKIVIRLYAATDRADALAVRTVPVQSPTTRPAQ